jgi:hypothetical protein
MAVDVGDIDCSISGAHKERDKARRMGSGTAWNLFDETKGRRGFSRDDRLLVIIDRRPVCSSGEIGRCATARVAL